MKCQCGKNARMVLSDRQPISICFIINSFCLAGAEILTRDLSIDLAERGHRILIYGLRRQTMTSGSLTFYRAASLDGLEVLESPSQTLKTFWGFCGTILSIRKAVKAFRPDIIHSHGGFPDFFNAFFLRGLGAKRIRTSHSENYWHRLGKFFPFLEQFINLLGDFTKIVSISQKVFENNCCALHSDRVTLILNGVKRRSKLLTPRIHNSSMPCCAIVGRLTKQKGQVSFLRYLRRRYRQDPSQLPFTLELIGDGPDRDILKELSSAFQGRVRLRGLLLDNQEIYSGKDVILIPSEDEGLSTVMLEAISYGIPVISFPVSGAVEALGDGACGIILKDFDAMVEKILNRNWPIITQEHYNALIKKFSWDTYVDKHEAMYYSILN